MNKLITIALCLFAHALFGQIDFTPYPGNATYCPGESFNFSSSVSGADCGTRTWTITNGKIIVNGAEVSTATGNSVTVKWDNTPTIGVLKVSVVCGANTYEQEKKFSIRSLTGRVPANFYSNQSLLYCSTNGVILTVDVMFLENTGGTTGVTQQRADGYEWTLPTGWSSSGSTGTVTSVQNSIGITPSNGCVGGSVTVKAYMDCGSGRKYSSSATLSLNRVGFSANLGVPAGYTGPRCGERGAVTFTAANLPCAVSYRWTATNTFWENQPDAVGQEGQNNDVGPWTTTGNTITLYPSGNISDGGIISVDIDLGCGIVTQTYTAIFTDPPLANPSYQAGTPDILCKQSTGTASVSGVPQAASYSWYTTAADQNISLNGAVRTSTTPLVTTGTSITITTPTKVALGYKVFLHVKANRQDPSCAGSDLVTKEIWIGIPVTVSTIALGLDDTPPFAVLPNTTYQFNAFDFTNMTNVTTYNWYTYNNHTIMSYSGPGQITANIKTGTTINGTYISVRPQNICGNALAFTDAYLTQASGLMAPPSNEQSTLAEENSANMLLYPNPANDEVSLTLPASGQYEIAIYDMFGNIVHKEKIKKDKAILDVKGIKGGVYVIKVVGQDQSFERILKIER